VRICSRCGTKYLLGKHTCPVARTVRRGESQSVPPIVDDEVVRVARAENEPLALMWVELLRGEGIASFAKGTGAWSPAIPVLGREHYIYVRSDDAPKALAILSPYAGPDGSLMVEPGAKPSRRSRSWRPL
jgi:hypothetical protein